MVVVTAAAAAANTSATITSQAGDRETEDNVTVDATITPSGSTESDGNISVTAQVHPGGAGGEQDTAVYSTAPERFVFVHSNVFNHAIAGLADGPEKARAEFRITSLTPIETCRAKIWEPDGSVRTVTGSANGQHCTVTFTTEPIGTYTIQPVAESYFDITTVGSNQTLDVVAKAATVPSAHVSFYAPDYIVAPGETVTRRFTARNYEPHSQVVAIREDPSLSNGCRYTAVETRRGSGAFGDSASYDLPAGPDTQERSFNAVRLRTRIAMPPRPVVENLSLPVTCRYVVEKAGGPAEALEIRVYPRETLVPFLNQWFADVFNTDRRVVARANGLPVPTATGAVALAGAGVSMWAFSAVFYLVAAVLLVLFRERPRTVRHAYYAVKQEVEEVARQLPVPNK